MFSVALVLQGHIPPLKPLYLRNYVDTIKPELCTFLTGNIYIITIKILSKSKMVNQEPSGGFHMD